MCQNIKSSGLVEVKRPYFSSISFCRSVVPSKKKCNSYCLKVTLAKKNGNKVTNQTRQTYVTINDVTATVPYITAQCREEFQNNTLILVSSNCLPIEDSDATKGMNSLIVHHITI